MMCVVCVYEAGARSMRAATLLLVCVLNVSLATAAVKEDPELQVGTWVLCVSGQGGSLVCVYLHSHVFKYDCRRQGHLSCR
jgi:hypothetical protein